MNIRVIKGAVLALVGALTIGLGHLFGLDLDQVALLGVTLGAVIALVPDRTLVERLLGFGAGFVIAYLGYALRAGMLPDTATGQAVAVFIVIIIAMVISVASSNRVPLWSILIGAAAMVGAYEQTYAASPTLFLSDAPTAATTMLLACAMGVVGAVLLGEDIVDSRQREVSPRRHEEVSA